MNNSAIIVAIVLFSLWTLVPGVRISPKLDFGSDNTSPDSAKFRPTFQSSSFNHGGHTYVNKPQGVDVTCGTSNCNATTNNDSGVSTDVLVHIKTNVDVAGRNSSTEAVPDVPIIVGTKTSTFPTYDAPNPYNDLPPLPISTLFRNPVQGTFTSVNTPDYRNYASGYQGNNGAGVNFYSTYNEQNSNSDNLPLPPFTWHNQKRVDSGSVYNPLEFKKVYRNTWVDVPAKWTESGFSATARSNPPNWTPCICPGPQMQYYQTAPPRY